MAAWDPEATNLNDLTDIQATSNQVSTQRAQWGVALEYEVTGVDETINKKRVEFTWYTNQSLDNTNNNYQLYIFNHTTGELLHEKNYSDTGKHAIAVNINSNETFIAYVAKKDDTLTNVTQLEDIQATSTAVFPEETSVTVKALEFAGGGNPSMADCNQQCYGDPVNSYNGEFFENTTDLAVNSLVPFSFTRSYSTWNKDVNRGLGKGWQHNYDMYLEGDGTTLTNSSYIKVVQENGSIVTFAKIVTPTSTYYVGSNNVKAEFSYDSVTEKYVFNRANGYSFVFGSDGKLEQLKDRNENALNLVYTAGKLSQITSTSGQQVTLTWAGNNITSVSDGTRTVTYTYSTSDPNLLSIVDLPETTGHKQYTYDNEGRIKRIIHPNGGWYENFYDDENRVTKQVNPLGGESLFSYQTPDSGNITTITLPDGTQNQEKYNRLAQLVEQKIAAGSSLEKVFTYEYDFTGQKSKETGPAGVLAQYTHDNNGNVTSVKDALNRVTYFTYNNFNQILTTTDALGKTTTNTYDETGNLLTTESPEGHVTIFEKNSDGTTANMTSPNDVVNETGKKTVFGYNSNKYLTTVTQPEGATTTITNNSIGNPLSVQSPLNKVTEYVYNANQQVVETIAPNLESSTIEYDNAGQIAKTIDSLNRETVYTYDLMGNVLTTTTVYGTTSYDYDNMQRVTKITEPDGAETEYEYNAVGQTVKIIDALNNETTMTYYDHGLVHTVTDARGNTTEYEYDAVGNAVKIIDDNNNFSTAVYDALNRVISSTSSNGFTVTYSYNDDGELISTTKAGVETTSYEYDANSNLVKTVYPDSSFEERTYDSDDQLTTITDRDGKTTTYEYDAEGKTVKTIRADTSEIVYSYTNLGQVDQISYDSWTTIDTDYEYDVHGRIISETKNNTTVTYNYDAMGNMTRRGPPTGTGVEYSYDQYGTITGITYPSGLELAYDYDLNGNLTTVNQGTQTLASYTYDPVGNLTRTDYGNGTFELNQYDNLNRLASISLNNTNGEFYKKQLELDNNGLIIGNNTKINSTTIEDKEYSYTPLQRLQNVTDTLTNLTKNYEYDTSSNLTLSPWGTNTLTPNGQLTNSTTQNNTVNYTHDGRGNRTNKTVTKPATPNVTDATNYTWTIDNKLDQYVNTVTENTGSTTEETKTIIGYGYDANGLLTSRQPSTTATTYVNGSVTSQSNSTAPTETFTWDTLSTIPTLIEDSTESYLYGVGSTPFAQINKTTGTIEYLHGDERGSIIAASTSTGAYAWFKTFDEYGYESTLTPQPGVTQTTTRFAYAGEYQDPDTGLYNLRARWFEPETGSFLNIDPALGSTGEAYSYASSNPLSRVDPLGLWATNNGWWYSIADGLAGFGDTYTAGITQKIRSSFNSIFGFQDYVAYCSVQYGYGVAASNAIEYASGVGGVVKTVAKQALKQSAIKVGASTVGKQLNDALPVYIIHRGEMPQIAKFTEEMWAKGAPKVLTYKTYATKADKNWNRSNRVKSLPPDKSKKTQRDEYPYTATKEGSIKDSPNGIMGVKAVDSLENQQQGADLTRLTAKLKDGDQFRVKIVEGHRPDPSTLVSGMRNRYGR